MFYVNEMNDPTGTVDWEWLLKIIYQAPVLCQALKYIFFVGEETEV